MQLLANRYAFSVLKPHLRGQSILEIGPAEGTQTELLVQSKIQLTLLEPTEDLANKLATRFPDVKIVRELIEGYNPAQRFDSIVISHVLEHVNDPVEVLGRIRNMLASNGVVCAVVPNGNSLHRQAGVLMGLLPHECALNEHDIAIGHRCVFSPGLFRRCFTEAKFRIMTFGGYWLKQLSNEQLKDWPDEFLNIYFKIGERYPEIAAEIYIIAEPLAKA